jgi:Polyketide cyclase / dehydrase and lipid transport
VAGSSAVSSARKKKEAMATITVSDQIAAPVSVVFDRFTDLDGTPSRVTGIKAIELLTPGPFRLGTRWRETREVLGRLDSAEMEVTAYDRNKTYTITHHKMGARVDAVFTFHPNDQGTKVDIEFKLEGQGLPPGLLVPVEWAIAGKIRDVLSQDLSDLKRSV